MAQPFQRQSNPRLDRAQRQTRFSGDFTVGQVPEIRLFYQFPLCGWQFCDCLAEQFAFLLQSLLAKDFTNRMNSDESDLSATLQMSQVAAARRS